MTKIISGAITNEIKRNTKKHKKTILVCGNILSEVQFFVDEIALENKLPSLKK